MKKAKKAGFSKIKKRGSFAKAIRTHLIALEKKTGQKRNELSRLIKKEEELQRRIEQGLQRLITVETKKVVRAKKTKDKTQKKFQESLKAFKERHQEFVRRSMIVERLRARQTILQERIQKMRKFVSKHAPKVAVEQQKELQQTIQETVPTLEPSVSITETEEPLPTETTEEEPIQPLEEEKQEEWAPEPVMPKEAGEEKPAVEMEEERIQLEPQIEPGFKEFSEDGISFQYPDWSESLNRTPGAIFSIEKDEMKFELFNYAADTRLSLEENTTKILKNVPDMELVSQENINHYIFVTYLVSEGENLLKHYALFAQEGNQLYKIEANGNPDKLDEQSALIVKVFKSFAVEENE